MFSDRISEWEALFGHLRGKDGVRYVEVGCYEGKSLCWMLDNILTGQGVNVVAIDPWSFTPDWETHTQEKWDAVHAQFLDNVRETANSNATVNVMRTHSTYGLSHVPPGEADVVYIDGSHRALACLTDMCLGWKLLKPGGLLVVDDVERWRKPDDWPEGDDPATAVQAFEVLARGPAKRIVGQAVFRRSV